ncbi:MAG TPA: CotH kinase family protein, partial [Polyangiaceae bacterium]|nr:CotH kinase family protein [Polyangiaceae bacterium]
MRSLKTLVALGIALGGTLACGGEDPCKPDDKKLDTTGEPNTSGGTGSGGTGPSATASAGTASGGIAAEGSRTGGSGSGGRTGSGTSIEGGAQGSTDEEGGSQATGGVASGGLSGSGSGGATTPPVKPLPGDVVFEEGRVLEFRMSLSDADWLHLEEHGDDEEYLPASATIRGDGFAETKFTRVGLRHKGAYSLERCFDNPDGVREDSAECRKLSYKIKFDEYVSESRLDGLKRINLHASATDPTKLRELLAYDTYRSFGVDAPRARPAKLYINDQFQGLFIAVEEIDGRYTKAHYPEGPDGNVYKEIWPHPDQTKESYQAALETNEDEADV